MRAMAPDEAAGWVERLECDDKAALDGLVPLVYGELRRMASSYLKREYREHTLQTTGLVHEVYLRLAAAGRLGCESRTHFYGIASRMMRQILVDHARERLAQKRGGGQERVSLDEAPDRGGTRPQAVIALDDALRALERFDPEKARLIELRFFAGLTAEESAELLGLPVQTVRSRLRVAQAWLRREIGE
jgi:RNA polymerase sigma factor (TIGR02999 family)